MLCRLAALRTIFSNTSVSYHDYFQRVTDGVVAIFKSGIKHPRKKERKKREKKKKIDEKTKKQTKNKYKSNCCMSDFWNTNAEGRFYGCCLLCFQDLLHESKKARQGDGKPYSCSQIAKMRQCERISMQRKARQVGSRDPTIKTVENSEVKCFNNLWLFSYYYVRLKCNEE